MKNILLTLLTSVSIASVCHAESYTLKLTRPEKVGNKAEVCAKGTDQVSQKTTVGADAIKAESTYGSASLDALREVLAVTAKGKPTKLKFTVKSLQYTDDKAIAPKEILAGDKEIIAVVKGKEKSFTIDGEEAGETMAKALNLVISLGDETNATDADAMFNTKLPHAVGDEWDAGIDELIKSMGADTPIQFDPKACTGKIKFERVEKVNGIECCILTGSITLLVPRAVRGVPEGTDFTGSTVKISLNCPVPTDPAAPEIGGKFVMDMALKADIKTPNDGRGTFSMANKMVREENANPVK